MNPSIIYRRFGGIYRLGRNTLALTDGVGPAARTCATANNLSPSYHQTAGIYHLSTGPARPSGSATSRRPGVRPNRPPSVRRFAPLVLRNPSGHSTNNRPITQPNRPTIYRRFDGIYRCRLPTSGLDFDNMPDDQKRVINNLPAMLYHGVNTESAVLMRMNAVPRSIAVGLGERFSATVQEGSDLHSVRSARAYLRALSPTDWQRASPLHASMSGDDYREVWSLLAGERLARQGGA